MYREVPTAPRCDESQILGEMLDEIRQELPYSSNNPLNPPYLKGESKRPLLR